MQEAEVGVGLGDCHFFGCGTGGRAGDFPGEIAQGGDGAWRLLDGNLHPISARLLWRAGENAGLRI